MNLPRPPPPVAAPLLLFALSALFLAHTNASPAMPAPPTSAPNAGHLTVTRSHSFAVLLPPAQAFTLFEPVGEKSWAEGWHPVFASASDAELSDNTVFTREASGQGHSQQSLWLITHYDRLADLIEYRAIYPGQRVSRITVHCRAGAASGTSVSVIYRCTGLSDDGDRHIAAMTDENYRTLIEEWASSIRAWLACGTPATP
jgi:hypothetical protein